MNIPTNRTKQEGFTIIEVVLVLAIAGLIFLMVFLALPTLQRNQRDNQRRSDISRLMSAINAYQTNNHGKVPAVIDDAFQKNYLKTGQDEFRDPKTGDTYEFPASLGARDDNEPKTFAKIEYKTKSKCGANEGDLDTAGDRSVSVRIYLEGAGTFCQDSQ